LVYLSENSERGLDVRHASVSHQSKLPGSWGQRDGPLVLEAVQISRFVELAVIENNGVCVDHVSCVSNYHVVVELDLNERAAVKIALDLDTDAWIKRRPLIEVVT